MTPYAVRLLISRPKQDSNGSSDATSRSTFEARWAETDGEPSEPFELRPPLSADDAADLRWYLERYHEFVGDGTRARAAGIEVKLERWGRALFDAAFGNVAGTQVHNNLLAAAEDDRPVLLTLGTTEPDVLVQPWELMRDREGPLAFRGVSIRRQLEGAKRYKKLALRLPLRLLLIVSRPEDSGFIDPRTSVRPLLDGLDRLPKGAAEVEFCEPPTLGELEERISRARKEKRPFHIVHFDGHGTYLPTLGVGALCFEKEDRKKDLVIGRRLGDLLVRLKVPLVILEACRTSDLSDQPVFGSVAPALLESGVGSVVAFSHSIHIEASRLLVERFYRELADGISVGQALSQARVQLLAKPFRWLTLAPDPPTVKLQDWFVPQLYQVGQDLSLVADDVDVKHDADRDAAPVLVRSWQERLHGFPPEPAYRFQGRARELLELGRAFEKHNAVVLAGMGGMGKTALSREAAAWWLRVGRFEEAVFCSFEQVRGVDRAVQILGQAIEGLDFSQGSPEEQRARAVALFRERRILLVWDNFESTLPQYQEDAGGALAFEEAERARLRAFYRELTEGKPEGRLLVTCRPDDTGLPRIKKLALKGLARFDSLHLLTAIADLESFDLERPGYERPRIEKLLDALVDHPLSISLVAPQLESLTPEAIRTDFGRHLDRFRDDDAEEGRNKSLRASLAFSASRLSEQARDVLPWLAWFQGGAFEASIVSFTSLEAEVWANVCRELESTALVRVDELPMFNNPFVRFHPTLPYAASADEVPDVGAAEERFLAVYLNVSREVNGGLFGQTAAAGMELMAREEGNVRAAIDRAFERGERQMGWQMADTLQIYLEMAGRRRERDALAAWVRSRMPEDAGLDAVACAAIQSHAEGLFAQGRLQDAVEALEGLAARLEAEGLADGGDPRFQIGTTYTHLGQILQLAKQSRPAMTASTRAIELLEQVPGETAQGNLSPALGTLANALMDLGRHAEALEASERAVGISEELGRHRNAAAGHIRGAQILAAQGRYAEAEARYGRALDLARRVNDLELQGTTLQHHGGLSRKRGDLPRSAELFEQAIGLFQRAGDRGSEMQTYDLLASTEMLRGHLDAAEAWYSRGRALAEEIGDQAQLAIVAQNAGILFQTRAEQTEDSAEKEMLLRQAVGSIEESLAIELERKNDLGAAQSYFQIGKLLHMLGDLERAERQLLKGLAIVEPLGLPDVWMDYGELAKVAEARGDAEAAATWAAKRDAKLEEVQRLAGGGDSPAALPEQAAQALLGLAQAVYAVRTLGGEVPPQVAEVLAQLDEQAEPLASAGGFLRAIAEGGSPAVPSGLPEPLPQIFGGLLASLE